MDFTLSRPQQMLRDMAREFAERELRPREDEFAEVDGEWPYDVWKQMAELGLIGLMIPEEYGGSGIGHLARILAIEQVSQISPGWGSNLRGFGLVPILILGYGTEKQKKKFLPRLCQGEIQGCLAVTEPSGGSDIEGIQTTAKRDGDYYIINGRKCMVSRILVADVFTVACRTGGQAADISTILVESTTPGLRWGRTENFITRSRVSHAGDLALTNCRVPVENRIGEENHGPELALSAHNDGGSAGVCLGIAQAALELGVKYAKERRLYGKPLTELETILFWLGDMERQTQRARWLCYHAAWLLDQGKKSIEITREIAMAKLEASEVALNNCLKAIELMGAYGTTPELGVIRKLKYALDMIADGGSNQVLRLALSSATVRRY